MGYIFKFLAFNIGQYIGVSLTISDLIIYFVMGYIIVHIIKNNKINDKEKRNFYINLLPILGVIGTFAGICIGLADFNSNEIEKSVPLLLQGLKTAFWTSLIGTSLAVFFNVWYSFKDKKDIEDEEDEIPLLKLQIKELQSISEKFNSFLENQAINNNSLKNLTEFFNNNEDKNLKKFEEIKNELKVLNDKQEKTNSFYETSLLKLEILDEINKKYDKNIENFALCNENISVLKENSILNLEENKKLNSNTTETLTKLELLEKVNTNTLGKLESIEKINTDTLNKNSSIFKNIELLLDNFKNYKDEFSNFFKASESQSRELITAFKEFATYMAEENSKAFIEALNKTIRDFNNNLIESFGSNFKQLNEAVIKLVDWQEEYKQIIETTTENQKVIFNSFNGIEKELQTFTSETRNINSIVSELSTLTKESMEQNIKLNETLNVFSELNNQAKELIPNLIEINNNVENDIKTFNNYSSELISNLDSFTNNLQTNFSQYIDDINKGIKGSTDNIIEIMQDSIKKIENNFNKSLENTDLKLKETSENIFIGIEKFNSDFSNSMKEQLDKFINNNENYSNEINKLLKNTIETMEDNERNNSKIIEENIKQIEKLNNALSNVLKEHVDNIEKELAESLNTSLNSLGEVMAKISDRFAKDYGPLADKLKEIVELSNNKRVR
ncbi:hypothetical protein [Fusobacterium polymorphum]|jgi:hypothetical protein|uniref:MotA/TolQ/ExbB proton channel domain-containing protein n=1 Tax=Fusobacterium nucleatum subsp. polymorphum TaxID=76857 RepID=A0A2C6CE92_FUSNP|nr:MULTISPECIES: hypothetical protein [Fusobacterium]MBW9310557.1 hypothetical protein [Fusobacterium nucleatum]PHI14714.1 hypothetical protein CBG56_07900 [Fusobacterium polymorphum]